jgi:hypothetical protein
VADGMQLIRLWYTEKMNKEILDLNVHGVDAMKIERYKQYIGQSEEDTEVEAQDGEIPESDLKQFEASLGILNRGKRHQNKART